MSDPEDSQMLESSSSSDDEAMFPSELEPPGTTGHDNLVAPEINPSDLSPPQSQEISDAMDTAIPSGHDANGADQLIDAAQGMDQSNGNGWEPKSEFAKSAELAHEPGSCWNNKKARDEWQKAWSQVEDKNFSLKEFGDPFDESERSKEMENENSMRHEL